MQEKPAGLSGRRDRSGDARLPIKRRKLKFGWRQVPLTEIGLMYLQIVFRQFADMSAFVATAVVALWASSAVAQAQDPMELQRLVWRCDYQARELGLRGDAASAHSNKCVEAGSQAGAKARPAGPSSNPPAASPARGKWQLARPSQFQVDLRIRSNDRAFSFTLTCMKGPRASAEIKAHLDAPAAWRPKATDPFVIDGAVSPLEIDGADSGYFVSDSVENNSAVVSPASLGALASGSALVVNGLQAKRPRAAVFDISNGGDALASFQKACGTDRPTR